MKIIIEGTEKEIEIAESSLKTICLFDGEFCTANKNCKDCEEDQNFKMEYIIKNNNNNEYTIKILPDEISDFMLLTKMKPDILFKNAEKNK